MQSLMFLDCFVQKLSKKTFGGSVRPPLGKGRVNVFAFVTARPLKSKSIIPTYDDNSWTKNEENG